MFNNKFINKKCCNSYQSPYCSKNQYVTYNNRGNTRFINIKIFSQYLEKYLHNKCIDPSQPSNETYSWLEATVCSDIRRSTDICGLYPRLSGVDCSFWNSIKKFLSVEVPDRIVICMGILGLIYLFYTFIYIINMNKRTCTDIDIFIKYKYFIYFSRIY